MLDSYLRQQATLQRALRTENGDTRTDERGKTLYASALSIPCRIRETTQEVLTTDKRVVKTSYVYYAQTQIREGDRLDGRRVELVSRWVGLGGGTAGYKAVT